MVSTQLKIRGRGAVENPPNRFVPIAFEREEEAESFDPEWPAPAPATVFYRDAARSIIAFNDSPDIPFTASVNPYRGCEHGCVYCYARPTHEYFGLSAGLDFETKIFVKADAPALLRKELSARKWRPQVVSVSGVTDPYQPVERRLKLTRRCLEVLRDFGNPVAIVTKNHLVTRDMDVLGEMAAKDLAAVFVSVTTLDEKLTAVMEPRTSSPRRRLEAISRLAEAGVPAGVMVAPVVPGLTDHEMAGIVSAAAEAGARHAGYVPLRLPHAVAPMFERWLEAHFPDRKQKVLNRVKSMRGGKLNDPNFGSRMRGEGLFAEQIDAMFKLACRKAGLNESRLKLTTAYFRRPEGGQLSLFSGG